MPKTIPAMGVLKAAATPAAPPARMTPGRRSASSRPNAAMIAAPTWTVGPSRPVEAPQTRPSVMTRILPNAVLRETRALRIAGSSVWRAAITWGIPEPCEFGNTRIASRIAMAKPSGVSTRATRGEGETIQRNTSCAQSASLAIPTAASPTQRPPNRNSRRCRHRGAASEAAPRQRSSRLRGGGEAGAGSSMIAGLRGRSIVGWATRS